MARRCLHAICSRAVFLVVVALGVGAGGAVTLLEEHADASRRAEALIGSVEFALVDLENAPFSVTPHVRASADSMRMRIAFDQGFIRRILRGLIAPGSAPDSLEGVQARVDAAGPTLQQVLGIVASHGAGPAGPKPGPIGGDNAKLQGSTAGSLGILRPAGRIYGQRAAMAKTQAVIGSLITIIVLLAVFALFYRRARLAQNRGERLLIENGRLLAASMDEAITDPLTHLGNRRAFKRDLEQMLPSVSAEDELMVGMFDLDGFKIYNDTFGHPAGDACWPGSRDGYRTLPSVRRPPTEWAATSSACSRGLAPLTASGSSVQRSPG